MTTTKTPPFTAPPPSLTAWQARSVHTITCPSGQRLRIRIPGVATILEHGDLPDDLVEFALAEVTNERGAAGMLADEFARVESNGAGDVREVKLARMREFAMFQRHLVCAAVVAVETATDVWEDVTLSVDGLDVLPEDDLALVSEIVLRLRASDARGVRIGVEPIDRWGLFREAHGCPDQDCPGCQELVERLSTADVGAV